MSTMQEIELDDLALSALQDIDDENYEKVEFQNYQFKPGTYNAEVVKVCYSQWEARSQQQTGFTADFDVIVEGGEIQKKRHFFTYPRDVNGVLVKGGKVYGAFCSSLNRFFTKGLGMESTPKSSKELDGLAGKKIKLTFTASKNADKNGNPYINLNDFEAVQSSKSALVKSASDTVKTKKAEAKDDAVDW